MNNLSDPPPRYVPRNHKIFNNSYLPSYEMATRNKRISNSNNIIALSENNRPSSNNTNNQNITNGNLNTAANTPVAQQSVVTPVAQRNEQNIWEHTILVKLVIGHAVIVGAICVTLTVLQIIMFINQYYGYNTGAGIWVTAYFIIPLSLQLIASEIFFDYLCQCF
jgi:hypothetical protein